MQPPTVAEAKRQMAEVADIEEQTRSRAATLVDDRALRRSEDDYSTLQKKLLQDQNTLSTSTRLIGQLMNAHIMFSFYNRT